jgi:hypothetical protein
MSIISSAANAYFTYKFLRTLTRSWTDMPAYELGIIDENGKVIKKGSQLKTQAEKEAYSIFDRLAFNIKRILEKLPFGKSKLASYATALFLIREHTGMTEDQLDYVLTEMEIDLSADLNESTEWFVLENNQLSPGRYTLINDIISPLTGEVLPSKGQHITFKEHNLVESFYGVCLYKGTHNITGQEIVVTSKDIKR